MDMTKEQIEKEFLRQCNLNRGIGYDKMLEIVNKFAPIASDKAVSITEAEKEHYNIKNINPKGYFDLEWDDELYNAFCDMYKDDGSNDAVLKDKLKELLLKFLVVNGRNVISIQRDKLIEVIGKEISKLRGGDENSYVTSYEQSMAKPIAEAILQSGSIREDKPFDRDGAINVIMKLLPDWDNSYDLDKDTYSYLADTVIDALIESGHLSSNLKEGEQRNPLTFEEFCKEHCGLTKGTTVHDGMVKAWQNAYKYYLIGFKQ
jgi:hypothetical protein